MRYEIGDARFVIRDSKRVPRIPDLESRGEGSKEAVLVTQLRYPRNSSMTDGMSCHGSATIP
jgi:hypothetical protein